MAHLFQVGAGSGGMPVLDMLGRDRRITRVTLVEPDVYKPHNVERHVFPPSSVGERKAVLAQRWLKERRPDLEVSVLIADLMDPAKQDQIESAAAACDLGVCAADNEPAKYHFDALMRKFAKAWTLGEVLSGGIGGFVHRFVPEGPCYGCVASHLKRDAVVEKPRAVDYSQPEAPIPEATIPAGIAAIHAVAGLHTLVTQELLPDGPRPADLSPFTLLLTLQQVPDVFPEAFRPYRFRVARSADCLICRPAARDIASEDLDVALSEALARLGHE
ncbi:MAG: ThiF family adenylyltransferase [Gemmataceae bacterium]